MDASSGDLIRALGRRVAGYVDADPAKIGQVVDVDGTRVVLGQDQLLAEIESRANAGPDAEALALGVGDNARRANLIRRLSSVALPLLRHPSAAVSAVARVERGTVILAGAVVNTGAQLGSGVIINSGAVVEHDCVLADCVHISPGAVLSGGVTVGERSWVGASAVVIQNVAVGAGCIGGAGTVVIRDVPDGTVVIGNPARPIDRYAAQSIP